MKTPKGTEYRTRLFQPGNPDHREVLIESSGDWVPVGTIQKLKDRDWEFVAYGIYFDSGKNFTGTRSTWIESTEAVARAVEPGLTARSPLARRYVAVRTSTGA